MKEAKRGRGRPRLPKGKQSDSPQVRLTQANYEGLRRLADVANRTIVAEANLAVAHWIKVQEGK